MADHSRGSAAGTGHVPVPAAGRSRTDRGAVTAETVMVLPVLVAVAMALAWILTLAATQIRVVDAAREVARSVARDDDRSAAVALGRRVAPRGSVIAVREQDGFVQVEVRTSLRGPHGLLGFLPPVAVRAQAVTAQEEQ